MHPSGIVMLLFFILGSSLSHVTISPLEETRPLKLMVQKRIGDENGYETSKEITSERTIKDIRALLTKGKWKRIKFERLAPPEFKLHFKTEKGSKFNASEIDGNTLDVWHSEIYIPSAQLYKKLGPEASSALHDLISQ